MIYMHKCAYYDLNFVSFLTTHPFNLANIRDILFLVLAYIEINPFATVVFFGCLFIFCFVFKCQESWRILLTL